VAKKRTTRRRRNTRADQEFISEAEETLEHMRDDLADLNDQRGRSKEVDPELVNRLFRSAHSLKALAGMFGFDPIHQLSHRLEDILDGLRLGRVSMDSPAVSLIEEAVNLFGNLLQHVDDADALAEAGEQIEILTNSIELAGQESDKEPDEFDALDLDPSLLRALTEYEEHRLRENMQRGRHIVLVESTFEIISFEEGLSELSAAIREIGEVLSTLPAPGEAPESQIRFSLLSATDLPLSELSSRLNFPNAGVRSVLRGQGAGEAPPPPAKAIEAPPGERHEAPRQPVAPTATPERDGIQSLKSISDTVRVDIRKLDELMNLVGELVIQRGAIGDIVQRLLNDSQTARIGNDLSKVYKSLDRKLKGLQASVLDVRMVPLRQVFDKISRVLRSLRRELGLDRWFPRVGPEPGKSPRGSFSPRGTKLVGSPYAITLLPVPLKGALARGKLPATAQLEGSKGCVNPPLHVIPGLLALARDKKRISHGHALPIIAAPPAKGSVPWQRDPAFYNEGLSVVHCLFLHALTRSPIEMIRSATAAMGPRVTIIRSSPQPGKRRPWLKSSAHWARAQPTPRIR